MYTFLLGSNIHPAVLAKAAKISKIIMPKMGVNVVIKQKEIKEINGGLTYTLPDPLPAKSEIHEIDTESYFVFFIGEIFEYHHTSNYAELVLQFWENGGWDTVRKIDGYFSVILIDKRFSSIQIVSDILGRRLLRYLSSQNVFLISSHDIPIVATGLCPIEYDFDTICSLLSFDHPLEGKSLLNKIKVCKSQDIVEWRNDKINIIQTPWVFFQDRIEAGDHRRLKIQIEKIIDLMKNNIKFLCKDEPSVRMSLTGGIDSRAIFGALINSVNKDIITAYTNGYELDPDVYMAKRIAQKFGVKHVSSILATTNKDHFIQNCDVLAYYRNGTPNSKLAVRPLFKFDMDKEITFSGIGGEIFRGKWYPAIKDKTLFINDLSSIICKKYLRLEMLPWSDRKFKARFKNRIENIIKYFSTFTTNGFDILDSIHLLERWPHWANGVWEPHLARVKSPFYRANLVLAAFQLPSPIGWKSPIHRQIINQYMGQVYWWPINNKHILPFDNFKGLKGAWRVEKLLCKLTEGPAQYRQGTDKGLKNSGLDVISLWTGPFRNLIRDILFNKDSIAFTVLENDELTKMFEKYCERKINFTETIGSLITIESWKSMVLRAKRSVQRE